MILAAWLAITVVAVPLAGKLSDVVEHNPAAEMPKGAESTRVVELADRFPDHDVSTGIVVYARNSGITAADRAKVDADRRAMAPLAVGQVAPATPSADGKALMLAVPLRDDDALADQAGKVRTQAERAPPPGLQVKLTGPAGAALDEGDLFETFDLRLLVVTVLVVMAVLLITYRSPVLWLLPMINAFIALQITNAVVYLLAEHAGMFVAPGAASILTVLVFGVSTDYAMLLLARYREELRATPDRHAAMAQAMRRAVPAIAASAATVSLGLLCLLAADMGFNYALGPIGAVGIVGALAVMTTLLPALLVIFGRWAFWPRIPRYGEPQPDDSRWGRIGDRVARRPRLVWVGSTLALGALAFGLLGVKTGLDSEHFTTTTPDSVVGQRLMAQHYPAGRDEPTQVIVAASAATQAGALARTVPGVAETQPPELSTDGRLAEIGVVLDDPKDSQAAGATVDRLRAALPETAVVGGSTATWLDRDQAQSHDRRVVIPLVLAVVLAVLMLLLRALVAPLLLIATVVLSYLAAFGGSWLLFQHVFGFPAVEAQIALMGFLFLVALGVDYNIFLVSRIREEVLRVGHADGVRRGLAATGGVISAAGLVLAATFGALMVLPLTMMVEMGAMVAFGVLLDTFLVRSVVVPALALDVGRRFWWPGRLARASAGERENRERALDIARR